MTSDTPPEGSKLTKIIQHAKYNAVIFTGLDTEGARKNTEYEVGQIKSLLLELVGEEDNSPMYFAELYEGQTRDAHNCRKGRNEYIRRLREEIEKW